LNNQEQEILHPTKGATIVFTHLKEALIGGQFHYDERLPSERELAATYGVARGTIRSALQRLEKNHLVKIRTGSGTFSTFNAQFDNGDIAEDTSPLELIEARLAIEPYIVKLATSNATNRDLKLLENCLVQLERTNSNPSAFSTADEEFHLLLARCSQNRLIIWMYQRINDIRTHPQWASNKDKVLTADKIEQYNIQHRAIVWAIKQRDAKRAIESMRQHLIKARQDLEGENDQIY